jgi:hypothetical protein
MDMTKMIVPGILAVALVLQVVSVATNAWTSDSVSVFVPAGDSPGAGVKATVEMGLWKQCVVGSKDGASADACVNLFDAAVKGKTLSDKSKTEVDAIRGLVIASIVLIPVFVALAWFKPEMKVLNGSVLALSVVAGVVAAGLWVNNDDLVNTDDRVKSLGYSYWLNVAGYSLTLVALLVFAFLKKAPVASRFGFRFY